METELKFRLMGKLKASELERLDWTPYRLGPRQEHRIRDVVLDTPGRTITGNHHGLRIRHDGDVVYVTLKAPGSKTGTARHTRQEWQEVIAADVADDLQRWPEAIRTRVQQLVEDQPLEPIVEVHNKRRTWEVWYDERVVAELALDAGEIRAGERVESLHEIEVELKGSGTEQDLEHLQRRLKQGLPLADEPRTKLQRGLALLATGTDAQAAPSSRDDGATAMEPHASMAEAGRAILRQHWEKLRASEPGVRKGDPEAVHDMRVATRRMRAMLEGLSTTAYDPEAVRSLRKGLKQLAATLGTVRDAEVWIEAVDEYAAGLEPGERTGLEPLLHELHARRDAGRAELLAALAGKRTRRLLDQLEHFVTTQGAGARALSDRPGGMARVRDVAGSMLWARLEAVHAFSDLMPEAPLLVMHELRIACKKLRYTLELFGDVLGAEGKRMRDQLTKAQDHFGALHDADVMLPFVERLSVKEPHNLALQRYAEHLRSTRDELWTGAAKIWTTIGGETIRKRLASTIVRL